jgi:ParE toxin of type II toxin-antitoxin system, parDE
MKLTFRLDFTEIVEEQAKYFTQEDSVEVAERFMDAVNETCIQISQSPMLGFARNFRDTNLKDSRIWRVKGFEKYLIFYVPKPTEIEFFYFAFSTRFQTIF